MRCLFAAAVVLVLLGSACARGRTSGLTLSGSTSLQPLAEKWAEAYGARSQAPSIAVQGGGSTAGIQATVSGTAQIGMVSRALTRAEQAAVRDVLVARDAIAIVVHPANPISDVSVDVVRDLYAGRVTSWSRLGGRSKPVTLITREEGSGTRAAFEDLVMRGLSINASALVQDSTGAVRQMVNGDDAAIGYISLGLVDRSVKALRLNGVLPTEQNVDEARYSLTRPFIFTFRGEPSRDASAFVSWINGPEGTSLTRAEGFLPARPELAHAGR